MLWRAIIEERPDPLRLAGLASNQQIPQRLKRGRLFAHHLVEQRRGEEHHADFLLLNRSCEIPRRQQNGLGNADQAGAVEQGTPDFKRRGIE